MGDNSASPNNLYTFRNPYQYDKKQHTRELANRHKQMENAGISLPNTEHNRMFDEMAMQYNCLPPNIFRNQQLANNPFNNRRQHKKSDPKTKSEMGIQSKRRVTNSTKIRDRADYKYMKDGQGKRGLLEKSSQGTVTKVKKERKKSPLSVTKWDGVVPFDPTEHCVMCRSRFLTGKVPHRSHHEVCPFKPQKDENGKLVKNGSTNSKAKNPFLPQEIHHGGFTAEDGRIFFSRRVATVVAKSPTKTKVENESQESLNFTTESTKPAEMEELTATSKNETTNDQDTDTFHDTNETIHSSSIGTYIYPIVDYGWPSNNETMDPLDPLFVYTIASRVQKDMSQPSFIASNMNEENGKVRYPLPIKSVVNFLMENMPTKVPTTSRLDDHNTPNNLIRTEFYKRIFRHGSITYTIPRMDREQLPDPNYHSIESQSILFVNWDFAFQNMAIKCPNCGGCLKRSRSNYSKNGSLFPIFCHHGPPMWAVVTNYECTVTKCKSIFAGNSAEVLASLPPHVRELYPVEMKYISPSRVGSKKGKRGFSDRFHLHKELTDLVEQLILTYSNGDHISRLLYNAINLNYLRRQEVYFSLWLHNKPNNSRLSPPRYPRKNGEWLTYFPPDGQKFRRTYEDGARSIFTPYGISDFDRHRREIQSVTCKTTFAQDHSHEGAKNYRDSASGYSIFDVCNENGEIACAVLVKTTSIKDVAHCIQSLARRENFRPKVMYCDTWPTNDKFWLLIFPNLKGCLDIFHFMRRITRTLRDNHKDYRNAMFDIRNCIYFFVDKDLNELLLALKNGEIGNDEFDEKMINHLMKRPDFMKRYGKYLRKVIYSPEIIVQKLEEFKCRYKVTSSSDIAPASGNLDPVSGKCLFTIDTANAIEMCKQNAKYLQDHLPLEEMYTEVHEKRRPRNNLKQYVSHRVDSRLEGFHDPMAHFANTGMSTGLCDVINHSGTARYNMHIRHKLKLRTMSRLERMSVPWYFEEIPDFYNESQLKYINDLARKAGADTVPHENIRLLPSDNGERFFAEYLGQQIVREEAYNASSLNNLCPCEMCCEKINKSLMENVETSEDVESVDGEDTCIEISKANPREVFNPKENRLYKIVNEDLMAATIKSQKKMQVAKKTKKMRKKKVPEVIACCPMYVQWSQKIGKKGRPPHNENCVKRKKKDVNYGPVVQYMAV